MLYFFTNHRNLLQIATKGYLSPFTGWSRYKEDFSSAVASTFSSQLIFSKKLLPFDYGFKKDKTLHGVAIGVEESRLEKLGYTSCEYGLTGCTPILFDLIDAIIFESAETMNFLQVRTPEYVELLDPIKISYRKPLFDQTPIVEKTEEPSEPMLSKQAFNEENLSRGIGSIGHMLSGMNLLNTDEMLLLVDLLGQNLKLKQYEVNWDLLENTFKHCFPEIPIVKADSFLVYLLLFYSREWATNNQIELKLDNYQLSKFRGLVSLIRALDQTLDVHRLELASMDRKVLFTTLSDNYRTMTGFDTNIGTVLINIIKTYDYLYDGNDLLNDIEKFTDPVTKTFLKGFEYYSRDPVDAKGIYRLIESHMENTQGVELLVAMYLWGRTQGAFSLDPVAKRKMLKSIGKKNFYSLVIPNQQYEALLVDEIKIGLKRDNVTDGFKYLEAEYYLDESEPIDHQDYEEIRCEVRNSTDLSIGFVKKDTYPDVLQFITDLDTKRDQVNPEVVMFLVENFLDLETAIKISGDMLYNGKPMLKKVDDNLEFYIDFKPPFENLNARISTSSISSWVSIILNVFSRKNISLGQKRRIRSFLNQKEETQKVAEKPASYEIIPTRNSTVKEMKAFLDSKGIVYLKSAKKTTLYNLIEKHFGTENNVEPSFL